MFASPLARRLAKDAGIDLSAITGSGPHGRVVKADVEGAKSGKVPLKAAPAGAPAAGGGLATGMTKQQVLALYPEGSYEVVPNDGMRKVVAARLTEAKQTIPHFYLTLDCKIDALLEAREQINSAAPLKDGKPIYKLSVNDFVIKAWALALQKVPLANATWAVDSILYHKASDVAVAVAVPGGLFTPVVHDADKKSLRQISRGSEGPRDPRPRQEARAARVSGRLLGDLQPRHVSASSSSTPSSTRRTRPSSRSVPARSGSTPTRAQVKTAHFMTVTVSTDHRAVDGALGAELLAAFKGLIEHPVMMLA